MKVQGKNGSFWRQLSRVALKTLLFTILFVILIVLLVHTPPAQNLFRNKAVAYLEKKLKTRVEIGRVNFALPKKLVLEDIYIEDQQKDTLISGGTIRANVNFIKLFSNEVEIDQLQLQNVTAKVRRILPDTAFNFKFIIDAFAVDKKKRADTAETAPLKLALENLSVENFNAYYDDVLTGDNLFFHLTSLNIKIDSLDPFEDHYNVPKIYIDGLVARFNQSKPLVDEEPISKDLAEAARPSQLNLTFGEADLRNIDVEYGNAVSAFFTQIKIGRAFVDARHIDLANRKLYFDLFQLNDATTSIRLGEKKEARLIEKEVEKEVAIQTAYNWDFKIDKVDINNNIFAFENDNQPKSNYGMDYGHLRADSFTLHVDGFVLNKDSIGGLITEGRFTEKSGFRLNELRGDILYAYNQTYLKDLYLKTPGTELKRYALLTYASYDDLIYRFPSTLMEADISDSYIQVKDILTFAPQLRNKAAFANPNATWYLNFQGNGTLASMHIESLQFRGLKNTQIDARGTLATSENPSRTGGTLAIRRLHTTQSDIALFTGRRLSNAQLNLPEEFDASGTLSGTMKNLSANLNITSNVGGINVNGRFTNLMNPATTTYTAVLRSSSLNLGSILRNKQLGSVSGNIAVSGKGITPQTINNKFKGTLYSFRFNDYSYRNIQLQGSIVRNDFDIYTDINDPNIDLSGNLTGNFSASPSFRFKGMIDSLKAMPLHLATQPIVLRGEIDANIPVMTTDNLEANVLLTNALIVSRDQRLALDTIQFTAGKELDVQFLDLKSDVANAHLSGTFRYGDIGYIFQTSIQPYFSVGTVSPRKLAPYDITFTMNIVNSPLLSAFIPGLGEFETIHAEGTVASGRGLNAKVSTPFILINGNEITGLNLDINTTENGLKFTGDVQRVKGGAFNIYHTQFNATALNNKLDFNLNIHDKVGRDKYYLAGLLSQPTRGIYKMNLHSDSLMLNYEKWSASPGNSITITSNNIIADNFTLQRNEQKITLQTMGEQLQANFTNFQISTITGFLRSDSLMVNGAMNGIVNFKNLLQQPVFTSDLVINDLSFKGDTLGNAVVKVDNLSGDRYNTNATITGRGNDVSLTGTFKPEGKNDIALDLDLNIRDLQLSTIEGVFGGLLKNASGGINGNIKIGGSVNAPIINGPINFDKASFALSILGSQFRVDQEKLVVTENGLQFDNFVILDTANNKLILDGAVQTANFTNFYFDLDVKADNFRILNTTKKDNKIYYGKLVVTTDLHIDGTEKKPIVDGEIAVNDGTDLTIVVPQRQPGVIQREGIVEFVDLDNPINDTLFRQYDSLDYSDITGMDITTNIEIKKEAIFNIVIDEANGDFINVQGEAQLSTGIDPSGKVTLVGTYELEKGAYEITFNFLHRRFDIQKGSKIIWLDRPTNATLDVSAVYIANTSPIDLVQSQINASTPQLVNTYRQKLPFQVHLLLTGELLHPKVSFDIVLPTDRAYGISNDIITQVQSRLSQLRQDPGEINKQVFSLLLLNRFVGPNPFESSTNTFSASNYIRQSVSKLLTGELNKLAAGLIDGVDLTFDVTSTDDYTTGDRRNRTDLNIGISKRLLNERLTVSVGSNFELQGPRNSRQKASNVIGNLSINYALSRDGRYMLRFYRRNEYEGVVDGYIIETGLSFLITVDYEKFSQLLRRKKKQRVEGVSENPK